jgi:hypothetical protein
MSQTPFSFVAYIDESGDEGFNFAEFPEIKSSEWFVLSAVVIRGHRLGQVTRYLAGQLVTSPGVVYE